MTQLVIYIGSGFFSDRIYICHLGTIYIIAVVISLLFTSIIVLWKLSDSLWYHIQRSHYTLPSSGLKFIHLLSVVLIFYFYHFVPVYYVWMKYIFIKQYDQTAIKVVLEAALFASSYYFTVNCVTTKYLKQNRMNINSYTQWPLNINYRYFQD